MKEIKVRICTFLGHIKRLNEWKKSWILRFFGNFISKKNSDFFSDFVLLSTVNLTFLLVCHRFNCYFWGILGDLGILSWAFSAVLDFWSSCEMWQKREWTSRSRWDTFHARRRICPNGLRNTQIVNAQSTTLRAPFGYDHQISSASPYRLEMTISVRLPGLSPLDEKRFEVFTFAVVTLVSYPPPLCDIKFIFIRCSPKN